MNKLKILKKKLKRYIKNHQYSLGVILLVILAIIPIILLCYKLNLEPIYYIAIILLEIAVISIIFLITISIYMKFYLK